jgi:hypothetical protein
MAGRFDARAKRLEALQGDDVDSLLEEFNYEQGQAILTYLMAFLDDVDEPSNENLSSRGLGSDRYTAALASIPPELREGCPVDSNGN